MKFTVLMCCNRDDGYLDYAIESILNQTLTNFEFIIVLNNCADELYNKLIKLSDTRIRLFRNSIGQLAFNLNYGAESALGEYIVRMDSDDIADLARLEKTLKIIESHPNVDIIAGSADLIDESSHVIGECVLEPNLEWKKVIYYKNTFIHPATTIKRSFLVDMKGYLGGFQSEDYDLWLRASKHPNVNVVLSKEKMIKYRISQTQARGNRLGYAEVSGFMMREFVMKPSIKNFGFALVALLKPFFRAKRK